MFVPGNLREEPGAGKPHARICEGKAEWPSYSTVAVLAGGERGLAGEGGRQVTSFYGFTAPSAGSACQAADPQAARAVHDGGNARHLGSPGIASS